jgi:hypothetical protein
MSQVDWNLPIDYTDNYGNTLLHIAVQNGSKRIAKLLMRKGAFSQGRRRAETRDQLIGRPTWAMCVQGRTSTSRTSMARRSCTTATPTGSTIWGTTSRARGRMTPSSTSMASPATRVCMLPTWSRFRLLCLLVLEPVCRLGGTLWGKKSLRLLRSCM